MLLRDGSGFRSLWSLRGVLAAATFNQQGQKQRHVCSKHRKENIAEPFTTMILNLKIAEGRARYLEWIKLFHNNNVSAQP